jgi:hypothetical protein
VEAVREHLGLILSIASIAVTLLGVSLYGICTRSKDHLIIDIRNVLADCRSLESWDDKSELKLPSWIGGDERELHRQSWRALRRIRAEMLRYYRIHLEMRDGEPFGAYQEDLKARRK